jgi:hypothetical protein
VGKLLAAMSPKGRYNYVRHWRTFTDWCTEHGHTPLPAAAATLEAFATSLVVDKLSPSTVKQFMVAIRAIHRAAGAEVPSSATANQIADRQPAQPPQSAPLAADPGPHPAPASDVAEANQRLLRHLELGKQLMQSRPTPPPGPPVNGKAPTPADIEHQPVDPMTLPLSAILTRLNQVESHRVAAVKANDRAREAIEARRAAEAEAGQAREALAACAQAREAAEQRATAAEEALAKVRAALGALTP